MVSALYAFALIISINSGFKEAPPTKKPSTSFWEASSLQVPPVTDPETADHKKMLHFHQDFFSFIKSSTHKIYLLLKIFGSVVALKTSLNLPKSKASH